MIHFPKENEPLCFTRRFFLVLIYALYVFIPLLLFLSYIFNLFI